MKRLPLTTAALTFFFLSSLNATAEERVAQVQGQAIKAHTEFLASDLLGSREAGERGYEIAAAYVAAQFAALGLEPAGEDGFFQYVPLRRRSLVPPGAQFSIVSNKRERILENGVDVAIDASPFVTEERFEAEVVFVGWGITAPNLGFDDYAGLDVKGKAVVLMEGAPASFPGALRAHYSWTQQKERMAAERGAIAVLTLKSPTRERFSPFELARRVRPMPQLSWYDDASTTHQRIRATISLSPSLARDLFAEAGKDLDQIYRDADSSPPRGFKLPMHMRLARVSRHEDTRSPNVLGVLRGTDPKLRVGGADGRRGPHLQWCRRQCGRGRDDDRSRTCHSRCRRCAPIDLVFCDDGRREGVVGIGLLCCASDDPNRADRCGHQRRWVDGVARFRRHRSAWGRALDAWGDFARRC
jgi:hypothetical protein